MDTSTGGAAHPVEPAPTPLLADSVALLGPARWSRTTGPGGPSPAPRSTGPPPVVRPDVWLTDTGWGDGDRAELRRVLNGRYDVYARLVTRTLAEEPGMRATGKPAELVPELVALCAYHAGERDQVNKALRTGADDRTTILARAALRGLRRLPAVLGPVFAAGNDAEAVAGAYRAGDELVEPAFVDADISGGRSPDAPVEYVIWSVSAHQLGRFRAGSAVFAPGSRFAVLAVDPPTDGRGPLRVLLRDRTGERRGRTTGDDRLLDRLRGALPRGPAERPLCHLGFVPGLDERGRRYAPPPTGDNLKGYTSGGARGVGFAG